MLTQEFADRVRAAAMALRRRQNPSLADEWIEEGLDDVLLWYEKRQDSMPADINHCINACAKQVVRVAQRNRSYFHQEALSSHRTRDDFPTILAIDEESDHSALATADADNEAPISYEAALQLLPAELRTLLLRCARESADLLEGPHWMAKVSQEYSVSRGRIKMAVARFRARLRQELGLSATAGWAEIRRELWRSNDAGRSILLKARTEPSSTVSIETG